MRSGSYLSQLRLLRPIRVLVVSRDKRFVSVFRFLLDREHLAVRAIHRQRELLSRVELGVDVVVFDATQSLADAANAIAVLEALHPEVGVVVVSERCDRTGHLLDPLPKWGPPQRLLEEIECTYLRLHRRERVANAGVYRPRPASPDSDPVETTS